MLTIKNTVGKIEGSDFEVTVEYLRQGIGDNHAKSNLLNYEFYCSALA